MADTIRDVVIRIHLEQVETKIKPPDYSGAVEAAQKASAQIQQAGSAQVSSFDVTKQRAISSQIAIASSINRTVTGVSQLARAFVLLQGTSDEDLKKLMKNLALVQGTFDLFTGSFNIIRGVSQALTAMQTASQAAAVGNTTLAASNTAVATTSTAASVGLRVMFAAMGPIGWAAIGIGAAVAAVAVTMRAFSKDTDTAAEAADRLDKKLDQLRRRNEARRESVGISQTARDEIRRLRGESIDMGAERFAIRGTTATDTAAKVEELTNRILNNPKWSIGSTQAMENLVDANKRILELSREQVAIDERLRDSTQDQLESQRSALDVAKQALQVEQERLQSMNERLGRIGQAGRDELAYYAKMVEAGKQLSEQQLQRVEQLGGTATAGFVGREYAKKGEAAGGFNQFQAFYTEPLSGPGSALEQAQTRVAGLEESTRNLEAILDKMTQTMAANNTVIERYIQRTAELETIALRREVGIR